MKTSASLTGVLALWLAGCTPASTPVPAGKLPALPAPPEDQIVARVNGRPLTIHDVEVQAQASGAAPKDALEALIRGELLAQAAESAGLAADPQVQRAAQQEATRRYLSGVFETEVTPQNAVTEERLHKVYENNRARLVHPDIRTLHQLLVQYPTAKQAQALALAQDAQRAAAAAKTVKDFDSVAATFTPRAKAEGLNITMQVGYTSRTGMTVEDFAKAAFEIKAIGDTSPVVQTQFGYHIIRYVSLMPEENVTYQEAKEKLREGVWPEVQATAFGEFEDRLAREHRITTFPERLAALQENTDGQRP